MSSVNSNPPFSVQPEWHILDLRSADMLPSATETYDLIRCYGAFGLDLYALVLACQQALKPGGWLVVHDLTVPDDKRAARYVNVFYQFRDPNRQTYYAEYEWRGTFLDVGLQVEQCEVVRGEPQPVFAPDLNLSDYKIERLNVLLKQMPAPVADFLQPWGVGSLDAQITLPQLVIVGQKSE